MKKSKALVMFSGGLDSRLVIKILQEQGLEIEALYLKLPFGEGCCNNLECVFNYLQINEVKLNILDLTTEKDFLEYLHLILNPKFGRGKSLNPCKDCRIFMLKKAKQFIENKDFDFIATGEVLDERPMSQTKKSLSTIDQEAGFENKILRPLSAKLLPETEAEKNNFVDRNKLFAIQGRQRKKQIELAKKYNIKYPNPGGGCLLCEKLYCKKFKDLINHKNINDIKIQDIQLLKIARHFRKTGKIILGRNEKENLLLEQLNQSLNWHIIIPEDFPGPTIIFENIKDKSLAEQLLTAYSNNNLDKRKEFERYII